MSRSPQTVWLSVGTKDRTVRLWMGLLLAVWLGIQIISVMVCFLNGGEFPKEERIAAEDYNPEQEPAKLSSAYWHSNVVAVGIASLAIVFMVGGVGMASEQPWAWRVLLVASAIQILFTVATQVWEATITPANGWGIINHGMGVRGAIIGILLWNLIPLGIFLLAIQGGKLAQACSQVFPAPPKGTETPGALKPAP
jgi:hypothetical protein